MGALAERAVQPLERVPVVVLLLPQPPGSGALKPAASATIDPERSPRPRREDAVELHLKLVALSSEIRVATHPVGELRLEVTDACLEGAGARGPANELEVAIDRYEAVGSRGRGAREAAATR